jgi:uncharacterized protein with GYD domain
VSRYVLLSTWTPGARQVLYERPGRPQEVDNEIQTSGYKVVDQYAVPGPGDFVTTVDAPGNETFARLAVDLDHGHAAAKRETRELMALVSCRDRLAHLSGAEIGVILSR